MECSANTEKYSDHDQMPFGNSAPSLRAHTPHKSMDQAFTTINTHAQSPGERFARLPTANIPTHSGHKSADFAMVGIGAYPNPVLTAGYGRCAEQGVLNHGNETAPQANVGLGDITAPGQATPKGHTRQRSSKQSVESPEIAAMLLSKLTDSAQGKPINSPTPTPDFVKETKVSLGVVQNSPRKRSPLSSVVNTDDEGTERGVSPEGQRSAWAKPIKGNQDHDGLLALRGRTNTLPTINGRQNHVRTQSLAIDGSPGEMKNSIIPRNTEGLDASNYTHGLPGSVSMGALYKQQAGSMDQPSGLAARSSSLDHFQGPSTDALIRYESEVRRVGPLEFLPVPAEVRKNRSQMLNQLTGPDGRPSIRDISHPYYVPFAEKLRNLQQSNAGVVCITNIPYAVSRSEIFAFLGRAAKSLKDRDEPVHIIMDRTTFKTYECFVEFASFDEAVDVVTKYQNGIERGAHMPTIGNRDIEMAISNQSQLMKKLFPLAKGVRWEERPFQITRNSAVQWENFKGFITQEEMTLLCKHVEGYNNPVFAKHCPERAYECMISTIKKFPWHMSEYITVKERDMLYSAGLKMVVHLQKQLSQNGKPLRLTKQLLNRLAEAIILSPGFSVTQKDNVGYKANISDNRLRELGQPRFAGLWSHLQIISVRNGVTLDVLEYYIAIVREETTRNAELQGIHVQQQLLDEQATTSNYWGFF
ncbi:hypothetical protein F5B19DRAFT_452971 [Rostrohypoxylon terebratum]|nr:hypothetical protein F5B19DRAFT_452971 [Rostrohypoxylon terebratum]